MLSERYLAVPSLHACPVQLPHGRRSQTNMYVKPLQNSIAINFMFWNFIAYYLGPVQGFCVICALQETIKDMFGNINAVRPRHLIQNIKGTANS